MVLQLIFPLDINLFEFDGYHPFLEAFDEIMSKTWLSKYICFCISASVVSWQN